MIHDRGDDADQFDRLRGDDVLAISGGKQVFFLDDVKSGYRIIYEMSDRFRLANIRKLLDPAPEGIRVFIVVVRNCPTSPARSSVMALGLEVEFFDIRELQYNVSRHKLVPKHVPIRKEEEIQAVLDRFFVKNRFQLPLILTSDPMAAYLALKPGQLVRIVRPSPSVGQTIVYRCCQRA